MVGLLAVLPLLALAFACDLAYKAFTTPLKHIPGPFLAKFTNLWRLVSTWNGDVSVEQRKLHKKYGSAVRIGPQCVSISDPALIRVIYSVKERWQKSDFYSISDFQVGGRYVSSRFGTRDEAEHTEIARSVSRLYAMDKILRYEGLMDETIDLLMTKLGEGYGTSGDVCPIHRFLHYFSWDFIGKVTFSKDLGYLRTGTDVGGRIHTSERVNDYLAIIGQMPILDKLFDKNPICRIGPPAFGAISAYVTSEIALRTSGRDGHDGTAQPDFLDDFLQIQRADPSIPPTRVVAWSMSNIAAGTDSTAVAIRAIVYFLSRSPAVQAALHAELAGAGLPPGPVSWAQASKLPYLDVVVKEAMRLHPPAGILLERIVPPAGLTLPDGRFVPGGTVIGINPWTVQMDEAVFGADADRFLPERWLRRESETEAAFRDRLARMNEADFNFGYGKRACVGKHVARLGIYKVVATLFARYKVSWAYPDQDWKTWNAFFVRQSDVFVRLEPRERL